MVGVVAKLNAHEGKGGELLAVMKALAEKVTANEPGNVFYRPFQAKDNPDAVYVLEAYESDEALAAHGQAEHFKAAGPSIAPLLAGAPEITYLND